MIHNADGKVVGAMAGVLKNQAEPNYRGGVNACFRALACLLVVASAFSLAPGTALAQSDPDTTPPEIVRVEVVKYDSDFGVYVTFNEPLQRMSNPFNDAFSLTVDGTVYPLDSRNLELGAKRFEFAFLGRVPVVEAAQSVIFSYRRTHSSFRLRDSSNNQVPSFAWDLVNNREIPPEQVAYAALGRYFEGTGSLSSAETFVSDYLAGLWAKIGGGSSSLSTGLSGAFNVGTPNEQRTAWGTDGTLNWHQVGGPGRRDVAHL